VGLDFLPGHDTSEAWDVSQDGATIVGSSGSVGSGASEAFRWMTGTGMSGLGYVSGDDWSLATAVSDDASVIVGISSLQVDDLVNAEPFRWTAATGMAGLGHLPGNDNTIPWSVSADGKVVVGASRNTTTNSNQAFRWTAAAGMVGLGFLPGHDESEALAVSEDGSVVVGWSLSSSLGLGREAFRWTQATGMVNLSSPPGVLEAEALGVSADGTVVVGNSGNVNSEAYLWDKTRGMRGLASVLTELGLDLTESGLLQATASSADGLTIVGLGREVINVNPGQVFIARGPFDAVQPSEPHIVANPAPPFVEAGDLVTLSIVGTAGAPYLWFKDGVFLADDAPRVSGVDTKVLTFDPVLMDDEGVYHATFDDGTKATAQTSPFVLEVLPPNSIPVAGGLGLVLLCGLSLAIGVRKMKKK
jgi:probable HAF family extracellular repeat protein